jgi:hypothetical protein
MDAAPMAVLHEHFHKAVLFLIKDGGMIGGNDIEPVIQQGFPQCFFICELL